VIGVARRGPDDASGNSAAAEGLAIKAKAAAMPTSALFVVSRGIRALSSDKIRKQRLSTTQAQTR
jgi:hypothetical protein